MTPSKILLTGASAGIGRSAAVRLLAAGHQVWGTARDTARLADLQGLHPLAMNLSHDESIDEALARGLSESGGFDAVINNAGYGVWGPLETLSADSEKDQFQVMVFGPLRIIRAVLPDMRTRQRGLIINVSSLAANFTVPFLGSYSACKAALASLSWSLQMELKGSPIRVVDLRPGDINTQFHESMTQDQNTANSAYAMNLQRAFKVYDQGMRSAPPPELVADLIAAIVARGGQGFTAPAVGNMFQSRIAPFLARFAPASVLRWCTGRYFDLR